MSAVDYLKADAERTELGRQMGEFHLRYDLLAMPSVAISAPRDAAAPGCRAEERVAPRMDVHENRRTL